MRKILALSILLLAACDGCATPGPHAVYPFDAKPLLVDDWFRLVHKRMEKCSGHSRSFDNIKWLVVEHGRMTEMGDAPARDGEIAGQWDPPSRIYLDAQYVHHVGVLRHEIGHYLWQRGDDLHEDPLFKMCVNI